MPDLAGTRVDDVEAAVGRDVIAAPGGAAHEQRLAIGEARGTGVRGRLAHDLDPNAVRTGGGRRALGVGDEGDRKGGDGAREGEAGPDGTHERSSGRTSQGARRALVRGALRISSGLLFRR